MTSGTPSLEWTDLDKKAVDTVRLLAADAVQKVGNGHPGTAMSLAPVAYLHYQRLLRHDPTDPHWVGRDRFILSCGHSSLTQYIQLYLAGYPMTLDDLKSLRTWGSQTPGHPEYNHTPGVEVTTGPLGQGVANAVGMAMAARRERGLLDPDHRRRREPVRPPHLRHRVRRRPAGGRLRRGVVARRHPEARQPDAAVGRQPASRSRTTPTWRSPRTSLPATRRTAGTCRPSTGPTAAPATSRTSRRSGRPTRPLRPSPTSRASSSSARSSRGPPQRPEHRRLPRLRPRRRRDQGDQAAPRLRPRARRSSSTTTSSSTRARPATVAPPRTRPGRRRSTPGRPARPMARLCSSACPSVSCPMAGTPTSRRTRQDAKGVATRVASGEFLSAAARQAARAVGRLGRPRRLQQHDAQGRAVVPAARALHRQVPGRAGTAACCTSASASTPWARS